MYREKTRTPVAQTCPYRRDVRVVLDEEVATCDLVDRIVGPGVGGAKAVPLATCEACCRLFFPDEAAMNPVVASLVLVEALAIIGAGGRPGCSLDRAIKLRETATSQLDELFADESSVVLDIDPTGVDIPLETLIPPPGPKREPRSVKWAVGVITAPRRRPTLARCLDSLTRAGFADPLLFCDGARIPPSYAHLSGTYRDVPIGAWSNFYLTLCELLFRHPDADAIMVVEDDSLFYEGENVKDYLDRMLWPGDTPGLLSLYCSAAYSRDKPGWYSFDGRWTWGALAFVFPRDLAKQFLIDHDVFEHRWDPDGAGMYCIDVMIGIWAERCQIPIWFPTPSLIQHIGDTSAIWSKGSRASGERRADRFAGDPTPQSQPSS